MMGPPDDLTPEDFEDTDLDPLEATPRAVFIDPTLPPKPRRVWNGETPDKCHVCQDNIGREFVDARGHNSTTWGMMCMECFRIHGSGLGPGNGQKYRSDRKDVFVKVAG